MEGIRIGYLPTRRDVFSASEARRYRGIIKEKISALGAKLIDIDDINDEGLFFSEQDLPAVLEKMRRSHVDGLFFPHCNFGTEDLVAKTAKELGKPVLLWGPRDDAPLADGLRTRDTQCGLFATGKVLRRFNIPFTYIENSRISDPVFLKGYQKFLCVCRTVRAFRRMRILQIGPRPDGFWSVICNEGELLERFGIQTFPVSLVDLVDRVKELLRGKPQKFHDAMDRIAGQMDLSACETEDVEKLAAMYTAIRSLCEEHGCTCAAIQCWNALQSESGLGVMPCMVNGLLTEDGIPVACETDMHGAITAVLLQESAGCCSPVFFSDMTIRHPDNDNAELLWHCGNFSPSLAAEGEEKRLGRHFIFPSHKCGTGEWKIRSGEVTVCRFDGDHGEYRLFIGEGRGTEGPRTKGTYFWLEVDNWPKWERTLVEGPYIHHCAGIHAKTADILQEVCKYIPGLQAERM